MFSWRKDLIIDEKIRSKLIAKLKFALIDKNTGVVKAFYRSRKAAYDAKNPDKDRVVLTKKLNSLINGALAWRKQNHIK